jgi:hypothetical protein
MQSVSDFVANVRAGDTKSVAAVVVVSLFLMYWFAHEQSEKFPTGFYGETLLRNNQWDTITRITHGDTDIYVEPQRDAGKWAIKALAPLKQNWVCIRVISSKKGVPEQRAYLDTMKHNSSVQIGNYFMNVDNLGTASVYWLRPRLIQNTNVRPLVPAAL